MKLKLGVALLALVSAVIIPSSLFADSDALPQAAPPRSTGEAGSHDAARAYASLPLHFEPTSEQGRFLARSGGYSVLIGAGESAIGIPGANASPMQVLRFTFDHASAAAQLEAIEPLPGVANYYVGQDPSKWRLGVRTFAKLRTKDVYPGVDVVYYGDHRRLEFDFVVAPMANAKAIALTLSGMDKLYVNTDGDLVAEVNGQPVRFAKPYAYQKVAGLAKRVSAEYALSAPNKAELKLGDYDKNLELVIDPVMSYSTYLGGSQADTANGIAVDTLGYAYITGQTCSIGKDSNPLIFPAGNPNTTGTTPEGVLGACDAYVTKLSPDGSTVVFTTFISGTVATRSKASASGNGIALDDISLNPNPVPSLLYNSNPRQYGTPYPNVYVVGTTVYKDMPIVGYTPSVPASVSPTWPGGDSDPFIAILDSINGTLIRTSYLGGSGIDFGYAIAVDPQQNVIVAGQTSSFDFPAYNGFEPITEAMVAFVTKLDFGLHIAPPILPGASPMSPRLPSSADTCGSMSCPATPDPTSTYYFFSAVYGGQLVAPWATWPAAGGVYPYIPWDSATNAYATTGYTKIAVPPYAITVATPYIPGNPLGCPGSLDPQVLVAFSVNPGATGYPQTAQGLDWAPICTSIKPGATVGDFGGFSWLIIGPYGISPLSAATEAYGVALDSHGDVFAVGGSSTAELHPSLPGPAPVKSGYDWLGQADTYWGGTGSWIIKLHGQGPQSNYPDNRDSAGWPVYVTALETTVTNPTGTVDAARGIAVDSNNYAYVVGTATGTLLTATGINTAPIGASDAYLLKMATPAQINYATYLGGTGSDQGLAVAVDAGGWAYVAGSTESTIPVVNAVVDGSGNTLNQLQGTQNAYLAKITPLGTALIMSAYLGGNSVDQANAIALSASGNGDFYVAGNTTSTNFQVVPLPVSGQPLTSGRNAPAGGGDAFVTMISGASFPAVTPSATNLNFPNQALGSTSAVSQMQTLTLQNTGTVTLHFLAPGISVSGDFSIANNTCGTPPNAQLSAGNSCKVTVSFTPTQANTRSGVLTILDDATDSPQTVGLTGLGVLVADTVTTNPATNPVVLTFASTTLGTTSAAQTVTVTNTDPSQWLYFNSPAIGGSNAGDFSAPQTLNQCTVALQPTQSCTVSVTFTPTAAGARNATLIINGNGTNMPFTVYLTGTGNGTGTAREPIPPAPRFTMTPTTAIHGYHCRHANDTPCRLDRRQRVQPERNPDL